MSSSPPVVIELYGVPRMRAGVRELPVHAANLGEAIRSLAAQCPALVGSVIDQDRLHPAYRVSLNAAQFLTDPDTRLAPGDRLLLIAADAGG